MFEFFLTFESSCIAFEQPHKHYFYSLVGHDFHPLDGFSELPVLEPTSHELVKILELGILLCLHESFEDLHELALLELMLLLVKHFFDVLILFFLSIWYYFLQLIRPHFKKKKIQTKKEIYRYVV